MNTAFGFFHPSGRLVEEEENAACGVGVHGESVQGTLYHNSVAVPQHHLLDRNGAGAGDAAAGGVVAGGVGGDEGAPAGVGAP